MDACPAAPQTPALYLHALVLPHDPCQLEVAFDLLPDLLEAVHNRDGGDGVNATQDVQSHVDQPLFPGNFPVLDDG